MNETDSLAQETEGTGEPLTAGEREVLRLCAEGLTSSEIAERLFVAHRTVSFHRSNVLVKTGKKTICGAAAWAIRAGLL